MIGDRVRLGHQERERSLVLPKWRRRRRRRKEKERWEKGLVFPYLARERRLSKWVWWRWALVVAAAAIVEVHSRGQHAWERREILPSLVWWQDLSATDSENFVAVEIPILSFKRTRGWMQSIKLNNNNKDKLHLRPLIFMIISETTFTFSKIAVASPVRHVGQTSLTERVLLLFYPYDRHWQIIFSFWKKKNWWDRHPWSLPIKCDRYVLCIFTLWICENHNCFKFWIYSLLWWNLWI